METGPKTLTIVASGEGIVDLVDGESRLAGDITQFDDGSVDVQNGREVVRIEPDLVRSLMVKDTEVPFCG